MFLSWHKLTQEQNATVQYLKKKSNSKKLSHWVSDVLNWEQKNVIHIKQTDVEL